jgi:hypothetical protein
MDHVGMADDVEALDDAALRQPALDLLAARIGVAERQRRRRVGRGEQGIRGVDDDLAGEVLGAGEAQGVLRAGPECREHGQIREGRGLGEGTRGGPLPGLRNPGARFFVADVA